MPADVLPDPASEFGARVRQRLHEALVAWFSTVSDDGTPQPNPVWFLWGEPSTVVIYNRAGARRLAHVATRPQVGLNLDGNGRGGDIVVLTGIARLAPECPPASHNVPYVAKYAEHMTRVSGSVEAFAAGYPIALKIEVLRVRGH